MASQTTFDVKGKNCSIFMETKCDQFRANMATEDIDITLENLLNLALGTPEIGAVNFNFLHEVIQEILKHLGISKKLARVTQELDYRFLTRPDEQQLLDNNGNNGPYATRSNLTNVDSPATQTGELNGSGNNQTTEPTSTSNHIKSVNAPKKPTSTTATTKKSSTSKEASLDQISPQTDPSTKNEQSLESVPQKQSSATSQVSGVKKEEEEGTDTAAVTKDTTDGRSQSITTTLNPTRTQSRRFSEIQTKRSSFINSRISQFHYVNEGSIKDATIVRNMEKRDSKTPAGDMWHVLNINRRVEAAEAAIQGMTNLIDTINLEVDELKINSNGKSNSRSSIQEKDSMESTFATSTSNTSNIQEQDIMKRMIAKLNSYEDKLTEMDIKVDGMLSKDAVKGWCTEERVNEIIKVALGESSLPVHEPVQTTQGEVVYTHQQQQQQQQHTPVGPTETTIPTTDSKDVFHSPKEELIRHNSSSIDEVNKSVLRKRNSRESRTRVAYQEVSSKMLFLEKEINNTKEMVAQLKNELQKKLELSDIDFKADKENVASELDILRQQIDEINSTIKSLENSYAEINKDVGTLSLQSDQFTIQQNSLEKSMRKLEQNIEDMTDNFHRNQSNIMKQYSMQPNIVDEDAINKIRGTLFDVQEQQSKFQNNIDKLTQNSIDKEKVFDGINDEIKTLQKQKADEEFVKAELESKVDRNEIINMVDRHRFDAVIGELDQNIQVALQKIEGNKVYTEESLIKLQNTINEKLDRGETTQIHAYIDSRLRNFKPKIQEIREAENTAAASRRQLIKDCKCISCDRPVEIPIADGITLPCYRALAGAKSMRPVHSMDMQLVRQHMHVNGNTWCQKSNKSRFGLAQERGKLQKELLQLCGVQDLEELSYATNRACGGGHTITEHQPPRRNSAKVPLYYHEEVISQSSDGQQETEVLGHDGHVYKGRLKSPLVLPSIPQQRKDTGESQETQVEVSRPLQTHPASIDQQRGGNAQHEVAAVVE